MNCVDCACPSTRGFVYCVRVLATYMCVACIKMCQRRMSSIECCAVLPGVPVGVCLWPHPSASSHGVPWSSCWWTLTADYAFPWITTAHLPCRIGGCSPTIQGSWGGSVPTVSIPVDVVSLMLSKFNNKYMYDTVE